MNVHVPTTQAGRMMAVATVLGPDVLLLEHLAIDEAVNALFTVQLRVKAQRDDLAAADLIGSAVDIRLKLRDEGQRWWNGFATHLHEGPLLTRGQRSYALTLRPKLWTLSQRSDCRIWQNTTTAQVIETLLSEHRVTDYALRVTRKLPAREYSVQWNETDLDYMLRRMEQDGLMYWHVHAQGRHTLVVADHASGYDAASEPQVRFSLGSPAQDHITDWRRSFAFTPGQRSGRDWNWTSMSAPGATQQTFASVPGNARAELYEYPGRFDDTGSAEQAMSGRMQATETGYETVEAASTVRTLAPGQTFTPVDVPKPENVFGAQVITAIRHEADDPTYEAAPMAAARAGQAAERRAPSYTNSFTTLPATTPATPHRTQRRPRINGQQVALIAGPEGEEIFTNPYGQVKVWFPWDRRAAKDGSDTCWIRVGQPWAGGTWGHQVIPRIGMECLVSYQEGDPDRPFVMALVPDPTNKVPYTLPDNKTRTVMRSNSYKSVGYNEMTFEDATGAENMFFHAQKDHTTKIENNQTISIGASHAQVIGQNQSVTVGENMTFEAGKSINMTIGGTGAGVAPLMAPFTGMSGITASLLGQALEAAGSNGSQGAQSGGEASQSASQVLGAIESALSGAAGTMVPSLAGSLIGLLNQTGIKAQQGVWHGPSPRPDAGTALAAAGNLFGQAVGELFNLPGMHNHITGTMRTDHCGCARVEQVGVSKVTHVGSTFATKVGKAWTLIVGKDATTKVGNDWSVQVKHRASIATGENIMLHAAGSVSVVADDSIFVGAKDDITQSAKTVLVHAEKITLDTGNASIELDKDGNITLQAAKDITLQAANQIVLRGGSASVTVGPGTNLANPPFAAGDKPSDFGVFGYVGKKLGGLVDFGDEGGWLGKQLDDSWVGHQVGKGFHAFGDYMINGYKMKDGTTVFPFGTMVNPDGTVTVPMPIGP